MITGPPSALVHSQDSTLGDPLVFPFLDYEEYGHRVNNDEKGPYLCYIQGTFTVWMGSSLGLLMTAELPLYFGYCVLLVIIMVNSGEICVCSQLEELLQASDSTNFHLVFFSSPLPPALPAAITQFLMIHNV